MLPPVGVGDGESVVVFDEEVVVLEVDIDDDVVEVTGGAVYVYMLSRFDPPQVSVESPVQGILQLVLE